METCIRGFSYMPQQKLEATDLQYVESGELEQTWRSSRRQRLKEQEQKIWEEFVKEKDIVKNAFKEDPYQFLHELPENCLKELMETELQKLTKECEGEVPVEQPNQGEGDRSVENQVVHTIAFAAEGEKGDDDTYNIFDEDVNFSGPDDEPVESPSTVRERGAEPPASSAAPPEEPTENVASLIESSIYSAKVKDLRIKLNEELIDIMSSLNAQSVLCLEREEALRRCRRAAEFSARFNRVYMYPLKCQANDLKRLERAAPQQQRVAPAQALAQLHHDLLQAAQVFHKSIPQTLCLREGGAVLRALCGAVCAAPEPAQCDDQLHATCDKLEETIAEYQTRVEQYLNASDNANVDNTASPPPSTARGRRRAPRLSKCASNSWSTKDTDARLSMYSLETVRMNMQGPTGGSRSGRVGAGKNKKGEKSSEKSSRNHKTSARSRVCTVHTLVETVRDSDCPSSHASAASRPASPRRPDAHRAPQGTPRNKQGHSPRAKNLRASPKTALIKKRLNTIKNEGSSISTPKSVVVVPISKLRSARHSPDSARGHTCTNKKIYSPKSVDLSKGKDMNTHRKGYDKDIDTYREAYDKHTVTPRNYQDKDTGSPRKRHAKDIDTPRSYNDKDMDTYRKDHGKDMDSPRKYTDELRKDHRKGMYSPRKESRQHGYIGSPGKEDSYTGKEFGGSEALTEAELSNNTNKKERDSEIGEMDRDRVPNMAKLLRQLCSVDPSGSRNVKVTGAKNAQLHCMNGGSPSRQASTPQLLRILEETIQKQAPKPMYQKPKNPDRYRLTFNVPDQTTERLFRYRTKFVQHMLASALYANSAIGKPWEVIGSVSEQILDEVMTSLAKEMEIQDVVQELYRCETN